MAWIRPPHPWRARTALVLLLLAGSAVRAGEEAARDPRRPPAIAATGVPRIPDDLAERLRPYRQVRGASFAGWSPDGRGMLVATRFGETTQLHRVHEPGGRREQVTFFEEPCRGRFLPGDAGRLLVSLSRGGDEDDQIYVCSVGGGPPLCLTGGRARNVLGPVSEDGRVLAFTCNRRDEEHPDVHVLDPRDPTTERAILRSGGEQWGPSDLTPDGKRLLVVDRRSVTQAFPFLVDVATGARTAIPVPGDRPAGIGEARFAKGGGAAWVVSDALGDLRRLARVDLASGAWEFRTDDLAAEPRGGDVEDLDVDLGSGRVVFTVNGDGASRLFVLDGEARREIPLPPGLVGGLEVSPDGAAVGFTFSPPDAPSDAYAVTLEDGRLTRWTWSEMGGLPPERMVRPTSFRYPSFDGLEIGAWIYRPREASPERKVPVVIEIHGGPEGQWRPTFSPRAQLLAGELSIAVIGPNVRGSTGRGRTFTKKDDGRAREDSVKDVGALLDWIATQPDLDASRVAVTGGSYGGYMVLASMIHFGDRIRAGIDVVGIANFVTFLERTRSYRRDLRRAEYGDERDPALREFLARISPTARAKEIRAPLLVAHGVNDPRVPFSEAEQIVAAVRANGGTVWTVYADNEGHGFGKQANRDYLEAASLLFLLEVLR